MEPDWLAAELPPPPRRQHLPKPVEREKSLSLWSIIKECVGKDLTRVCLPVFFNEPLSALQKTAEDLEYSELLDEVCLLLIIDMCMGCGKQTCCAQRIAVFKDEQVSGLQLGMILLFCEGVCTCACHKAHARGPYLICYLFACIGCRAAARQLATLNQGSRLCGVVLFKRCAISHFKALQSAAGRDVRIGTR